MDGMESSNENDEPLAKPLSSFLAQTTEEVARAAVAAAAAIRPKPSIVVSSKQPLQIGGHNNSFVKWRRQLQKVWKWGLYPREGGRKSSFNPEVLTKQKRQWIELQLQALERKKNKTEPSSIFEHFVVVGLPPETNVEVIEAAFAKKKAWERDVEKGDRMNDADRLKGHSAPRLEPQVLFRYPPGKRLPLRNKDLPEFCFPTGVEARVVERTPSMSDLNEVVYGQEHQKRDDLSFVFLLKVADNATLYGVCVYVREIVQRPPGFLSVNSALSSTGLLRSRFLVSAPRCYCILTKLPFFHLHFEVLQSIIAQERLDRINQCVSEMRVYDYVPPLVKMGNKANGKNESPQKDDDNEDGWMDSAIPVEDVLGATAAAAGLISESDVNSFKQYSFSERDTESGESAEVGDSTADSYPVLNGHIDNDGSNVRADSERSIEISPSYSEPHRGHERAESSESVYSVVESSIQSLESDEDAEASSFDQLDQYGADAVFKWAEENCNDALRVICMYYQLPIPARGASVTFQPMDHVQPIVFNRPGDSQGDQHFPNGDCKLSLEMAEARDAAMAEEEAILLSLWTVSTVCRALSIDTILAMLAGALLEKQMVVICPNVGILSAIVLSIIPMLRPFQWQSVLLPVLPHRMLDFLDAPVPFIAGVQHKNSEVRAKISNLMRVNVYKNQVTVSSLPQLPRQRELAAALEPFHTMLSSDEFLTRRQPVHECMESQARNAEGFLKTLRSYLDSLCEDVRSHTITNVQSNNDRVSLLLKESFIDSYPSRDRPFIKLFADTQLFSVHTDAVLSSF